MSQQRTRAVADALISLGYDGIVKFDASEPEYDYLTTATERFDEQACVALLSIPAGTQDYQLAGDAQQFWRALEEVVCQ